VQGGHRDELLLLLVKSGKHHTGEKRRGGIGLELLRHEQHRVALRVQAMQGVVRRQGFKEWSSVCTLGLL